MTVAAVAYWLIAIRCPFLGPFPSIGGGAHRPLTALCPSSSSLPYLSLSTSLSFPLAFPSVGGRGGGGCQGVLFAFQVVLPWHGRCDVQEA